MRVIFWGTRGSLPATVDEHRIRGKIRRAVIEAIHQGIDDTDKVDSFLDSLPFSIRGTHGTNTACVEIRAEGDARIICDAGTGLRDFGNDYLAEHQGKLGEFHIFISHPHWDHIQGFPFFRPSYLPGNRVVIYGCHENLEDIFRRQQEPPTFPIDFDYLSADISFKRLAPATTHTIAGFRITPLAQNHPGDSYAYKFEKNGQKVVYSTDNEHKDDAEKEDYPFLDYIRDADLLVFDAQYSFSEAVALKEDWGHSSNVTGVELAKRAGVKTLCLFHQEPTYTDEALDEYLAKTVRYAKLHMKEQPLNVLLARDGLVVEI